MPRGTIVSFRIHIFNPAVMLPVNANAHANPKARQRYTRAPLPLPLRNPLPNPPPKIVAVGQFNVDITVQLYSPYYAPTAPLAFSLTQSKKNILHLVNGNIPIQGDTCYIKFNAAPIRGAKIYVCAPDELLEFNCS